VLLVQTKTIIIKSLKTKNFIVRGLEDLISLACIMFFLMQHTSILIRRYRELLVLLVNDYNISFLILHNILQQNILSEQGFNLTFLLRIEKF
jgi:predicted methyltransferase